MQKVIIKWQDQFGNWQHYTTMHHQPSAYRTAKFKSKTMKKRMRLTDAESGGLLDLIDER